MADAKKADERRGIRWVDRGFQRRYALILLSFVVLISSILIGTFWFHSNQILLILESSGVVREPELSAALQKSLNSMLMSVIVAVLLFSTFVFVMAFFLSHRIVGPIYAIKRSLEHLSRKEFAEAHVHLRSDDEFHEVADLINSAVDSLKDGAK